MCYTREFVFSGKTVTLARLGGQVKIGQKGTKEGLVLAPYSPHSASLSDQPSAEVGPTYCTRGEPIQGEKRIFGNTGEVPLPWQSQGANIDWSGDQYWNALHFGGV